MQDYLTEYTCILFGIVESKEILVSIVELNLMQDFLTKGHNKYLPESWGTNLYNENGKFYETTLKQIDRAKKNFKA